MDIQWFPGHMAKTRRLIEENIRLVDVVLELRDARLPESSRNPLLDELLGEKPRLVLLNKADLADEEQNRAWINALRKENVPALLVCASSGKGMERIAPTLREMMKEKIERDRARGIMNRSIKLMVVGIPNVGKSSFINRFAKKGEIAKTGDRPGVTKSKQWIRLKSGFELLDTPGILWPKFEEQSTARKLAFTGAIRDEILDAVTLSFQLLEFIRDAYPTALTARYKITDFEKATGDELMTLICKKRGFLASGAEPDTERGAAVVLDEFRAAKIGRMTLERPERDGIEI